MLPHIDWLQSSEKEQTFKYMGELITYFKK